MQFCPRVLPTVPWEPSGRDTRFPTSGDGAAQLKRKERDGAGGGGGGGGATFGMILLVSAGRGELPTGGVAGSGSAAFPRPAAFGPGPFAGRSREELPRGGMVLCHAPQ